MKRIIAVYTGTGNSLYAAKAIEGAVPVMIEDLIASGLPDGTESLGFSFPVYCWGVPFPMRSFIREHLPKWDTSGLRYIFAIATYGGFPLHTLADLEMELMDIGLVLSYGASVKMPDGYLPLQRKAQPEDRIARMKSDADEKLKQISRDISEEKILLPRRGLLYRPMRALSQKAIVPRKSSLAASDRCTRCSLCAKICPMGNIRIESRAEFGDSCISCFACYHRCPENAIIYPKAEGQFRGLTDSSELVRHGR